jgi:hypothetical protein
VGLFGWGQSPLAVKLPSWEDFRIMNSTAPHLTGIELGIHQRLFDITAKQVAPVGAAEMWRILQELRNAPELERFGLFLVGSRLDPGNEASDIDLVLAPRPGSGFSDVMVERALRHCREYGLNRANPACVIDPAFRWKGPSLKLLPLPPLTVLHTAKLFSPKLARLIRQGRIRRYRRFGRFSVEYWRYAGDTGFYQKLPQQRFGGSLCAYLRPAIELIEEFTPDAAPR